MKRDEWTCEHGVVFAEDCGEYGCAPPTRGELDPGDVESRITLAWLAGFRAHRDGDLRCPHDYGKGDHHWESGDCLALNRTDPTPAHDPEMAAARDADRVARVCCGGECSGCPVGEVNLAGLVADMQDECSHEWLDRPESDTYECLICGIEGQGAPPARDRVARVAEGGGL